MHALIVAIAKVSTAVEAVEGVCMKFIHILFEILIKRRAFPANAAFEIQFHTVLGKSVVVGIGSGWSRHYMLTYLVLTSRWLCGSRSADRA